MRTAARLAICFGTVVLRVGVCTQSAHAAPTQSSVLASGSALDELARSVASSVAGLAPGAAVIGLAPLAGGSSVLRPEIAVRIAVRVASRLGAGSAAWPYVESESHALALPRGARPLVLVEPRLEGERVVVNAQVIGPAGGAGNGALGRFVARAAIDAEVRAFLGPLKLAPSELRPVAGSEPEVLALACADANADGTLDLATVSRARVTLGTLATLRYEIVKARRWGELAPVAPVPLREPFASATYGSNGELLVGITDRARALRLRANLEPVEPAPTARLPWPGGGCARVEDELVAPRAEPCGKGERSPGRADFADALDAFAGANVIDRAGRAQLFRAGRSAKDGSVTLTDGTREVRVERAGAALAVGDLDGDGVPELVASVDTPDAAADAVVVYAWSGAALKEAFRLAMPAGVRSLAICPGRVSGIAPVVIGSNSGLWVMR